MADRYTSIDELLKNEVEGRDFQVRLHLKVGRPAVIAPHGGGIEPGTSEIAEAVAGDDFSFYAFEGIKPRSNGILHITSTRFNEPRCLDIVQASPIVIAIHGEESRREVTYVGGLHKRLLESLTAALAQRHFAVERHTDPLLQGNARMNICNRSQSRTGIQLELSRGLRASFFQSLSRAGRELATARLNDFVTALREAVLADFEPRSARK